MDDGKTHTVVLRVSAEPRVNMPLTRVRAHVTARLLLAVDSLRLTCAVCFSSLARSLCPSLLRFRSFPLLGTDAEVLDVRDCLSRPAVSKANDLPWNLDNLSARLQPPRPGLHLFCTRVCLSLSLSLSLSFLVCPYVSVALPSFSFLRGANRIEGVLTASRATLRRSLTSRRSG